MTRNSAIKLLAGVFGGMFASRGQDLTLGSEVWNGVLAKMNWGDPVKSREQRDQDWADCNASITKKQRESGIVCSLELSDARVPGTAMLTLNLDGWKGFTVTLGKETRFISRQELWDALKEKP